MDHFFELADRRDLPEAIVMVAETEGTGNWGPYEPSVDREEVKAAAKRLQLYSYLVRENPSAWRAEVNRSFHQHPALAAVVWWHLRFCREAVLKEGMSEQAAPPALIMKLIESGVGGAAPPVGGVHGAVQHYLAKPDCLAKDLRNANFAVPFTFVLDAELRQITTARQLRSVTGPEVNGHDSPIRRALSMDLLGLSFSGGGIRSATFNLGVLQALARMGLLRRVDYLSTVSGGGYIGSWFAAWMRREADSHVDTAAVSNASGPDPAVRALQRALSPVRSPNPMDERVRPIRFLREYSNYLTPRTGFFSADTWTMIGIFVRNALLNQVIIVSLLAAALLGPRLAFGIARIPRPEWIGANPGWLGLLALWAVPLLLWLTGMLVLVVNLQTLRVPDGHVEAGTAEKAPSSEMANPRGARWAATGYGIQLGVILPWTLATVGAVTIVMNAPDWTVFASPAGIVIGVTLAAVLLGGRASRCWPETGAGQFARVAVPIAAAAAAGGVSIGLIRVVIAAIEAITAGAGGEARTWHAVALGPPGLLSAFSLSIVAMLGVLGQPFPDEHREWWSKLRTFIHVWALAWLAGFVAAVYVPRGVDLALTKIASTWGWPAVLAWIASTWFGVQRGSSAANDEKIQRETPGEPSLSAKVVSVAEQSAPFVFVLGLVVAISVGLHASLPGLTSWIFPSSPALTGDFWHVATLQLDGRGGVFWSPLTRMCAIAFGLAVAGVALSWRVDVNDFSLHHFYKNRLVRCYLGASRSRERDADWFTGFDPDDDVRLRAFDHENPEKSKYPGPYPIINTALNLVGGKDLAWQERKAASFVFTPKYCGYDVDRAVLTKSTDGVYDDAYVPTERFYQPGSGPMLGMAMAISGAAANPNMGRASTPALAFLMTVFNVRLGWWVGNPRSAPSPKATSPWLGLPYTALELFGAADDEKNYVNLSDGGHFENLGVYELLRRGCRYIIACDSGQDGKFLGEDLGTLIRQARTDFGIEIEIDIDRIRDRSPEGLSRTHCVVGKIHYLNIPRRNIRTGFLENEDGGPLMPGSKPAYEQGYLIYLKPSMTGDEPQDLMEFFKRIPEFPHQSTADQWFDESQFESYRKLGMHVADEAFCRYRDDDTRALPELGVLFDRLYGYWYPPSDAVVDRGTAHANEYSRLMELLRANGSFAALDPQLFDDWPKPPAPPASTPGQTPSSPPGQAPGAVPMRDEFYICNGFIQLMENVYADLDLEHNAWHPHVRGWMRVFEYWAQQPAFRRTWKVAEWTYAERFRTFYNDRIAGRAIAFPRAFVAGRGCQTSVEEGLSQVVMSGANALQLDVRRMACGTLVVCAAGHVAGVSMAGTRFDALPGGAGVPRLQSCLEMLRGRIQLLLMLHDGGTEDAVLDLLLRSTHAWRRRDFVLVSADSTLAARVHARDRRIRVGLEVTSQADLDRALADFTRTGVDFLAPAHSLLADRASLKAAVDGRVPLVPWADQPGETLAADLAGLLRYETVAGVVTSDLMADVVAAVNARASL